MKILCLFCTLALIAGCGGYRPSLVEGNRMLYQHFQVDFDRVAQAAQGYCAERRERAKHEGSECWTVELRDNPACLGVATCEYCRSWFSCGVAGDEGR